MSETSKDSLLTSLDDLGLKICHHQSTLSSVQAAANNIDILKKFISRSEIDKETHFAIACILGQVTSLIK